MDHSCFPALLASVFAILFRDASVQVAFTGEGRAAPSLASLSASSLPATFKCPGTQRTRKAPGRVCGRRVLRGHLQATSLNSLTTECEEPVECDSRRIATSRLSRKTHRSVANLADGNERAALAPLSAAAAFASKTSAFLPREKDLRSIRWLL